MGANVSCTATVKRMKVQTHLSFSQELLDDALHLVTSTQVILQSTQQSCKPSANISGDLSCELKIVEHHTAPARAHPLPACSLPLRSLQQLLLSAAHPTRGPVLESFLASLCRLSWREIDVLPSARQSTQCASDLVRRPRVFLPHPPQRTSEEL